MTYSTNCCEMIDHETLVFVILLLIGMLTHLGLGLCSSRFKSQPV
ncbi:MAG: hypothetical protein WCP70_13400 [Methanothrix sp.]